MFYFLTTWEMEPELPIDSYQNKIFILPIL